MLKNPRRGHGATSMITKSVACLPMLGSLKKAEDDINLKIVELQEFSDNQTNTIEVLREQLGQVMANNSELEQSLQAERAITMTLTEKVNQLAHDLELSTIENHTVNQRLTESKELHDRQVSESKADIARRDADSNTLRADFDTRIKACEVQNRSLDNQVCKLQTALDIQDKQITEAKAERMVALSAEKSAIEKAAALAGQLERVLEENKALAVKVNVGIVDTTVMN
jgi:chromosome segregation ATPase